MKEVMSQLAPPYNAAMRTGVSILFSLLQDEDSTTVLQSISTLLDASAETQVMRPWA